MSIVTTRHEAQACVCGQKLDAASGECEVQPGDYTVCVYCGRVLRFGEGLKLEPVEIEELEEDHRKELEKVRRLILGSKNPLLRS